MKSSSTISIAIDNNIQERAEIDYSVIKEDKADTVLSKVLRLEVYWASNVAQKEESPAHPL